MFSRRFVRNAGSYALTIYILLHAIPGARAASTLWLNVKDFGAAGDGVTDDLGAVQAALNSAGSSGGGIVYAPPGTYFLRNVLVVPSRVVLQGAGTNATIIRNPPGQLPGVSLNGASVYASIALVAANNAGVTMLQVDHLTNNTDTNGIVMVPDGVNSGGTPTTYSFIEKCRIEGANTNQILIWDFQGQFNKIRDNVVNGNVPPGTGGGQYGIELFGAQQSQVLNNVINNVGNSAILVGEDGVLQNRGAHHVLIQGNNINGGTRGVSVALSTNSDNIAIADNIVTGQSNAGILLSTVAATVLTNASIRNNSISDQAGYGIQIDGGSSTSWKGAAVSSNEVTHVTGTLPGINIGNVQNVEVIGNTVSDTQTSPLETNGAQDLRLVANTLRLTPDHALQVINSQRIFITANSFVNYSLNDNQHYGILIAGTSQTVQVMANVFKYGNTESLAVDATSTTSNVQFQQNVLDYTPALSNPFFNATAAPPSAVPASSNSAVPYNVKDFGAKADGRTDDQPAIQSALNAAGGAGGGIVSMPAGIYYVSNTLRVPSGVILEGAGMNSTVIRNPAGQLAGVFVNGNWAFASIAMVAASNSGVRLLQVDHLTNGTDSNGIVMVPDGQNSGGTPTTYSFIEQCRVEGFNTHQYLIWNLRGQWNTIRGNIVHGNVSAGITNSQQEGIELFGGANVQVLNNTVTSVGASGIFLSEDGTVPNTSFSHILVDGNNVSGPRRGINLTILSNSDNIIVTNNIVTGQSDKGIILAAASSTVLRSVSIRGNNISDQTGYGIKVDGGGSTGWDGIAIASNVVRHVTGSLYAMNVSSAQNIELTENAISDSAASPLAVLQSQSVRVVGNTVRGTPDHGFRVTDSSDVFITGNSFVSYSTNDNQHFGLLVSGTSQNVRVASNIFKYGGPAETFAAEATSTTGNIQFQQNILDYVPAFSTPFVNNSSVNAFYNVFWENQSFFRRGVTVGTSATGDYYQFNGSSGVASFTSVKGAAGRWDFDARATTPGLSVGTTAAPSGGVATFNGKAGFGTASPSYMVHAVSTSAGAVAGFANPSGSCTINPSITGGISCSSDLRLKKNVRELRPADALVKLGQLRPVSFQWRADAPSAQARYGFLAQDVEKIFPEFVSQDANGYHTVAYSAFTPLVIGAVNDLNQRIQSLEAERAASGAETPAASSKEVLPPPRDSFEMRDSKTGKIFVISIVDGEWSKSPK